MGNDCIFDEETLSAYKEWKLNKQIIELREAESKIIDKIKSEDDISVSDLHSDVTHHQRIGDETKQYFKSIGREDLLVGYNHWVSRPLNSISTQFTRTFNSMESGTGKNLVSKLIIDVNRKTNQGDTIEQIANNISSPQLNLFTVHSNRAVKSIKNMTREELETLARNTNINIEYNPKGKVNPEHILRDINENLANGKVTVKIDNIDIENYYKIKKEKVDDVNFERKVERGKADPEKKYNYYNKSQIGVAEVESLVKKLGGGDEAIESVSKLFLGAIDRIKPIGEDTFNSELKSMKELVKHLVSFSPDKYGNVSQKQLLKEMKDYIDGQFSKSEKNLHSEFIKEVQTAITDPIHSKLFMDRNFQAKMKTKSGEEIDVKMWDLHIDDYFNLQRLDILDNGKDYAFHKNKVNIKGKLYDLGDVSRGGDREAVLNILKIDHGENVDELVNTFKYIDDHGIFEKYDFGKPNIGKNLLASLRNINTINLMGLAFMNQLVEASMSLTAAGFTSSLKNIPTAMRIYKELKKNGELSGELKEASDLFSVMGEEQFQAYFRDLVTESSPNFLPTKGATEALKEKTGTVGQYLINNPLFSMKGITSYSRILHGVSLMDDMVKMTKQGRTYSDMRVNTIFNTDTQTLDRVNNELLKHTTDKHGNARDVLENLNKWDPEIKEEFFSILRNSSEKYILKKNIGGEVPELSNSTVWKTVGQFKNYAFKAHQAFTMNIVGGNIDARESAVLATSIAAGMLVYYGKVQTSYAGQQDKVVELFDEPDLLVANSLKLNPFLGTPMIVYDLGHLYLDEENSNRSYYHDKSITKSLLDNPSLDWLDTAWEFKSKIAEGEVDYKTVMQAKRIFGTNAPGIGAFLNYLAEEQR